MLIYHFHFNFSVLITHLRQLSFISYQLAVHLHWQLTMDVVHPKHVL